MLLVNVLLKIFDIFKCIIVFIVTLPFLVSEAKAKDFGKYDFKVLRVIDGDTVDIEAEFLPPELGKHLKLRIYGIDTPEKGHQAKCNAERRKSEAATEFVREKISNAKDIKVEIRKWDKFGGRVLGDLILDGERLSDILISEGHAVSYDGGRKNKNWC
jgi:endonuclease YncB( thermonuclease family)